MKQSKKHSHIEVLANQILGIIIGFTLSKYVLPTIIDNNGGYELNANTIALHITLIFFISSYSRSYLLRRYFNALAGK